jgi:hypothetical protein
VDAMAAQRCNASTNLSGGTSTGPDATSSLRSGRRGSPMMPMPRFGAGDRRKRDRSEPITFSAASKSVLFPSAPSTRW